VSSPASPASGRTSSPPSLGVVAREWGRIGCLGFGGPPAHIALLRELWVDRKRWLSAAEFEDAIAATNLLPGPASTQLAIFCAWRLRGVSGALVGGACFIVPGLVLILALAVLFLAESPPTWVRGAGAGAGRPWPPSPSTPPSSSAGRVVNARRVGCDGWCMSCWAARRQRPSAPGSYSCCSLAAPQS